MGNSKISDQKEFDAFVEKQKGTVESKYVSSGTKKIESLNKEVFGDSLSKSDTLLVGSSYDYSGSFTSTFTRVDKVVQAFASMLTDPSKAKDVDSGETKAKVDGNKIKDATSSLSSSALTVATGGENVMAAAALGIVSSVLNNLDTSSEDTFSEGFSAEQINPGTYMFVYAVVEKSDNTKIFSGSSIYTYYIQYEVVFNAIKLETEAEISVLQSLAKSASDAALAITQVQEKFTADIATMSLEEVAKEQAILDPIITRAQKTLADREKALNDAVKTFKEPA